MKLNPLLSTLIVCPTLRLCDPMFTCKSPVLELYLVGILYFVTQSAVVPPALKVCPYTSARLDAPTLTVIVLASAADTLINLL